MTQYLLAAEADQIQDFLFRASHLREVVGGSQLLTRFCKEVPKGLLQGKQTANIIINDGGKFLLIFDDERTAKEFGEQLAEAYRRMADGTLTVAEPVPINGGFGKASEEAEENLRKAKRCPWPSTGATPHFPYMANCNSCGVGLAVTRGKQFTDDNGTKKQYLCRACKSKEAERNANIHPRKEDKFFYPFMKGVVGDELEQFQQIYSPEDISDPRRYVAYLLADGNNMGKVFNQCQEHDKMKQLSESMTSILQSCLAESTKQLFYQPEITNNRKVPVLPLIIGGDDIFALLPAPWALSFAMDFCQNFHEQVGKLLDDLEISWQPTLSLSVVICKETFPHTLAHDIGKGLLDRAKQAAKACLYETGTFVSTIDFEVIMGSQTTMRPLGEGSHRPTLRPYFIMPQDNQNVPDKWGLPLKGILDQRWVLHGTPQRRLAQLRSHFDKISQGDHSEWSRELKNLMTRIQEISEKDANLLQQALDHLGSEKTKGWLYQVKRKGEKDVWHGHGLPDLLTMWDFTYALDKQRIDYEE